MNLKFVWELTGVVHVILQGLCSLLLCKTKTQAGVFRPDLPGGMHFLSSLICW